MAKHYESKYSWLNVEFLTNILLQTTEVNPRITNFSIEPAVGKSENYLGEILRVNINYSCADRIQNARSIIIKVDQSEGDLRNGFDNMKIYQREIVFYRDILPQLEAIAGTAAELPFTAKCFQTNSDPNYLVFEDLKALGYENLDRKLGLTLPQVELVIKKLALFHAASAVLRETNPTLFRHHNVRACNPDEHFFRPVLINAILESINACPEDRDVIKAFSEIAMEKGYAAFDVKCDGFNVLNHGDMWMNNFMFKKNAAGLVDDVIFIDFQLGYYGSPGLDLGYLLYTTLSNDTTEHDWDHLLKFYQSELKNQLNNLDFKGKIPSHDEIRDEFKRAGMYGVIFAFLLNLVRQIESADVSNVEILIGASEEAASIRKSWCKSEQYQKRMRFLVDYFKREGFLNPVEGVTNEH